MASADSIRVASVPTALPGGPPSVLVEHVRDHPRIDAAVFVLVDAERGTVEPGASWFASPIVERAITPQLSRPFDSGRPGFVETVLDRAQPLFLMRVDSWEAAGLLRAQVEREAGERTAEEIWEALGQASMIACPVQVPLGRTVGMLAVASLDPERPLERGDLATATVLADLLAMARERVEASAAGALRQRRDLLLKRAAEDTAASLEISEVERQVVAHARELVAADRVVLTRSPGAGPEAAAASEVARYRRPQVGGGAIHVPVELGPRLFGVLSAVRESGEDFEADEAEVLGRLARSSAAAMANAVDFDRERRIARALTRGFVPDALPDLPDWELGLLYEPAAHQPAGGDVYGAWEVPGGDLALLVGDVAGKGVETAALSAMTRFFIEARSWDSLSPAETLRQASMLLHERLPSDTFVTAFFALITSSGLRYANAGHVPPLLLPAGGGDPGEAAGGGLPLGIERNTTYEECSIPLGPGDTLLAYTDGIAEARGTGELFGAQRLREAAAGAAGGSMEELVTAVHQAARRFSGGLQDDAVLLALRHR